MFRRRGLVTTAALGVLAAGAASSRTPLHGPSAPLGVAAAQERPLVPEFRRAVKSGTSIPLRKARPRKGGPRKPLQEREREVPIRPLPRPGSGASGTLAPLVIDPVLQTSAPTMLAPKPTLVFSGLSNKDNDPLPHGQVVPPDTNGDVGPNHYVQAVNTLIRVYSKSGVPLTAPITQSSLFTGFGGVCESVDSGDPIVLYDHLADRWLISQFSLPNYPNPPFHQCVAISQTGDPTGAYYLYDFQMVNSKLNDYPHFGVWPDAYYMTDNQFDVSSFAGAGAWAFERAKMLTGDPAAGFIYFDLQALDPNIGGLLPAGLDGTPPPAGTPNYLSFFTAAEDLLPPPDNLDALRVFEFHVDFATPANSTFTERPESPVAVAPIHYDHTLSQNDIDQPPPSTSISKLDTIGDRLMHRLQYRNFGAHESLVVNHTVDADPGPAYHAAVRYYELRRPLPGGAFAVNEQATFAPDAAHRWMGSAAMDHSGNLAVGYSVSSASIYPSLRYAGRLASDPPNGLSQGETTLKAGTGSQTTPFDRWGDYSNLAVDPVDECTFWYTNEYYAKSNELCPTTPSLGCWHTAVARFAFPACASTPKGSLTGNVKDALTGAKIAGATITASAYSRLTTVSGGYSMTLPTGSYDVSASAPGYETATLSSVPVRANAGTVRNLSLRPKPHFRITNLAIDDSAGNNNGIVDFNECVKLAVTIENDGFAPATGVSAVLSTGTTDVSVGQSNSSYADVPAGGSAANNVPFKLSTAPTFQVGTPIDVTLSVATDQGMSLVSGSVPTGTVNPPVSFTSSVQVPIPDNTPAGVDSPTTVSGITGAVAKVTASLWITHTFDSDLQISLVGPDATTVVLASGVGGGANGFGINCGGGATGFDDDATTAITGALFPFTGTYRPQSSLSTFAGKSGPVVDGTWNLHVADVVAQDAGNIECWRISIADVVGTDGGGTCSTANNPPTANAGPNQSVNEGASVTLNATASSDPDGDPLAFTWTQTGGPPVTLSNPHSPTPRFLAPAVGLGGASLTFQVTVADTFASSATSVQVDMADLGPSIRGTVSAGSPIPGAKVWLYRSAYTAAVAATTTDANGQYAFVGLTAGRYIVRVVKLPLGSGRAIVDLGASEDRIADVTLR